jgi:predicted amidohydrolase YtcJ
MKVFTNTKIISPSANISISADAIAVKDGIITAIGTRAKLAADASEVIDLNGAILIPGFVDPHTHPLMYGQMMNWVDVGPNNAKSITEIVAILKKAEAALPVGVPLRAFGYEHRNLEEGRHPERGDLDQISTVRDIYVMNASGHGGAVNTLVLKKNGITWVTPDPKGGAFERDAAGNPTGVIWDAACDILTGPHGVKLTNHGPNFHLPDDQSNLTKQFMQAQHEFTRHGVTSVGDLQVSQREFDTYKDAKKNGGLKVRYFMYLISSQVRHAQKLSADAAIDNILLTAKGIKIYADGTLGGWTAYFPEGYKVDKNRKGQLYHDAQEFESIFLDCAHQGYDIATHAQSPTAIEMVISSARVMRTQKIMRSDGTYPIVRIEHCGLPKEKQSQELSDLEIIAVNQPIHHHNWGDGVITAVGNQMGERFNPLGEFVKKNVAFALSSDAPVGKPNPFEAMAAAMDRLTVHGSKLGSDDLKIDAKTAFMAHTMGGARALGKAELIGSIEVGKYADFAVVDANPLDADAQSMRKIQVLATYLGGQSTFERRPPQYNTRVWA